MLVLVQYICHGLMAVVIYHHVSTCTVYLSWFDGCSYVSPCWYVYSIFVMVGTGTVYLSWFDGCSYVSPC